MLQCKKPTGCLIGDGIISNWYSVPVLIKFFAIDAFAMHKDANLEEHTIVMKCYGDAV